MLCIAVSSKHGRCRPVSGVSERTNTPRGIVPVVVTFLPTATRITRREVATERAEDKICSGSRPSCRHPRRLALPSMNDDHAPRELGIRQNSGSPAFVDPLRIAQRTRLRAFGEVRRRLPSFAPAAVTLAVVSTVATAHLESGPFVTPANKLTYALRGPVQSREHRAGPRGAIQATRRRDVARRP